MEPTTSRYSRWVPSALFSLFLLGVLLSYASTLGRLPMEYIDMPSHMVRAYMTAEGIPFLTKPLYVPFPFYYYFGGGLYAILGDIYASTFLSVIFLLAFGILGLYGISKTAHISFPIVALGLVNPLAVLWFIKFGRLPELLGFYAFISLLFFIIKSVENKENNYFGVFLSLMLCLISGYVYALFAFALFLAYVWYFRRGKIIDHTIILLMALLVLAGYNALSYANYGTGITSTENFVSAKTLVGEGYFVQKALAFAVPMIYFACMLAYIWWERKYDYFRLFTPFTLMALLVLTRAIAVIPILSTMKSNSFNVVLLLLSTFLYAKSGMNVNWAVLGVCIIMLASGTYYLTHMSPPSTRFQKQWQNILDGGEVGACRPYYQPVLHYEVCE